MLTLIIFLIYPLLSLLGWYFLNGEKGKVYTIGLSVIYIILLAWQDGFMVLIGTILNISMVLIYRIGWKTCQGKRFSIKTIVLSISFCLHLLLSIFLWNVVTLHEIFIIGKGFGN